MGLLQHAVRFIKNTGMRRAALLTIYKLYVLRILQFGYVFISRCAAYRLCPLILMEKQPLLSYVARNVLYRIARIIPLDSKVKQLTMETFLRLHD